MTTSKCFFLVTAVFAVMSQQARSQALPEKASILEKVVRANAYFMKEYPDPSLPIVTNVTRPSNIWTRAVYYEGLMGLYGIHPQQEYIAYALEWSRSHQWQPAYDIKTRDADNQCCGQTYIDLYLMDKQPERIQYIKECIDSILATDKIDDWSWIDAMQMAMPVYARLGVVYNDDRYFDRMYAMYTHTKRLFNAQAGLWWRDSTFLPPYKEPNGQNCFWSRGNGWVVAALVRVMKLLPDTTVGYSDYKDTYLAMMHALLPLQREDGFWNVSLNDPEHLGGKETSGTSLFLYGMAWGVEKGWLDRTAYMPAIVKAWNGLANEALHPDGMLGYIQGTGKQPSDGQPVGYDHPPDFRDYGVGCFLLAGSEVYRLASQ
jgi:unsaturated rhamnogalacturonyl hydrolase